MTTQPTAPEINPAVAQAVTILIARVESTLAELGDNRTFAYYASDDDPFDPAVLACYSDAAIFTEAQRRLHEIRAAIALTDSAHRVAEALEAANPTGAVVGEAERAVIREALG